jgi:hypothetical protein
MTNARHGAVLVGLDVHGIQSYLFGTSKLKEVVGASRIVDDFTGPDATDAPALALADLGLSAVTTGLPSGERWFVPVRLGGGVVRLLLPSAAAAHAFVRKMSEWALVHADGLEFDAAWIDFDLRADALDAAERRLVAEVNKARQAVTRGNAFNGFPFTAPCRLTGDPAEGYDGPNERLCAASLDKREYQVRLDDRWATLSGESIFKAFHVANPRRPFIFNLEDLCGDDPADSYMAVVALDMNSLGELGKKRRAGKTGIEALHASRAFVEEITGATKAAFCDALNALTTNEASGHEFERIAKTVGRSGVLPLRPLVFGGDDLTFVMHGALAPRFACALASSLARKGFHSGVGIAFVKVKSPLSRAIELAEILLARAKGAGRDDTHIDFMLCSAEVAADASERDAQGDRPARGPYTLEAFGRLLENARILKHDLPSSHVRGAVDGFRASLASGRDMLKDLAENIDRGLGGGQRATREARSLIGSMLTDDALAASYIDCVDLFRFIAPRPERGAPRDTSTNAKAHA